jgi:hypothetical protein
MKLPNNLFTRSCKRARPRRYARDLVASAPHSVACLFWVRAGHRAASTRAIRRMLGSPRLGGDAAYSAVMPDSMTRMARSERRRPSQAMRGSA